MPMIFPPADSWKFTTISGIETLWAWDVSRRRKCRIRIFQTVASGRFRPGPPILFLFSSRLSLHLAMDVQRWIFLMRPRSILRSTSPIYRLTGKGAGLEVFKDMNGNGDVFDDSFLRDTRITPRGNAGNEMKVDRYSVVIPPDTR